jgi:hypothetical protein
MSGRGGYIGTNVTPAASAANSATGGVWTVREAESLKRAGTWPITFVNPTSITGLELWLDASDPSVLFDATTGGSLVAADGEVARWEDKSGNARHMTQDTLRNRPIRQTQIQGGKDVLYFNGTRHWMSVPNSTATFKFLHSADSTVFIVLEPPGSGQAPYQSLLLTCAANRLGVGFQIKVASPFNAGRTRLVVDKAVGGTWVVEQETPSGFLGSGFSVLSAVVRPTSAVAADRAVQRRNGGGAFFGNTRTDTVSTANSQKNLTIAYVSDFEEYANARIAEIIIYSSALSDTNRLTVESYLMTKWGIS